METRAIAFFFAIGTAAGGIAGPLIFGIKAERRGLEDIAAPLTAASTGKGA